MIYNSALNVFLLAVWRAKILPSTSEWSVDEVLIKNLHKLSGETVPKMALDEAKSLPCISFMLLSVATIVIMPTSSIGGTFLSICGGKGVDWSFTTVSENCLVVMIVSLLSLVLVDCSFNTDNLVLIA